MDDTHRLVKRLQQATDSLLETAGTATSAVEQLRDLVQDLAAEEPITFVDLGSGFRQQSDTLHAALTGLGDEMEALNSAVKSTSDTLTADLRLISDQFHAVSYTHLDVYKRQNRDCCA